MKKCYVMIHVYTQHTKLAQVKTWFFPTALIAQTAQKLQIPVSFHVMFCDKHTMGVFFCDSLDLCYDSCLYLAYQTCTG